MAARTTVPAAGRRYGCKMNVDQRKETAMESVQTESSQRLATLRKCAHPDCTCTVVEGEEYCSDYCLENMRADSTKDEEGCACGHAECVSTVAIAPVAPFTS
jgi:hypothetical protein